jgi:hypothetical protein
MNKLYIAVLFPVATVAFLYSGTRVKGPVGGGRVTLVLLVIAFASYMIAVIASRMSVDTAETRRLGGPYSRAVHNRIPNWVNAFVSVAMAALIASIAIWFV